MFRNLACCVMKKLRKRRVLTRGARAKTFFLFGKNEPVRGGRVPARTLPWPEDTMAWMSAALAPQRPGLPRVDPAQNSLLQVDAGQNHPSQYQGQSPAPILTQPAGFAGITQAPVGAGGGAHAPFMHV
jgi:hypothetical protein